MPTGLGRWSSGVMKAPHRPSLLVLIVFPLHSTLNTFGHVGVPEASERFSQLNMPAKPGPRSKDNNENCMQ